MAEKQTEVEVKREPARAIGTAAAEWEPIRSLRHQIDRLMADFDWPDLRRAWPRKTAITPQSWPEFGLTIPPVDLVERNGGYELQAELPGLTSDQIEVRLSNGMVTIKGEKSSERVEDDEDYHLSERSFGTFQRSFRVPVNVDADKIEAKFDKGVLKVSLPKSATAIRNERKIDVKAA
ncbi:Hsp20/alpha crystallin family protein [Tabrizicola sp.]|uniref:Hsp20/alpha crystallin family protein n=1 Tax=Tabrizicola sp. TaxID=2005166 RepID=UPI00262230DC|nr:Hsp20/alpha crystallin family protein [Tabrizicola sp.]MDM7932203.1 Hsp20/alpha crystallin family protein [Tabrizicola sp.]